MSSSSKASSSSENSLNETAWEEGMVTPQQLSVADSTVSQIDPVSIFYNATSATTAANATHSLDAKNDISSELDASVVSSNDRFFTFENLFEDLEASSSVSENNGIFSTSTATAEATTTTATTPATENLNRTSNKSASYITTPRTIQPVMLTTMNTVSSPVSENATSSDTPQSPEESSNGKKKQNGGRKRKAESLEEKEARARERVLRNRHAAQMSRDKKRRQLADLESQNALLKEDNIHLSKRIKLVEEENAALSIKLETISAQLAEIQSHLAVSEVTKLLLDGVRGSAASATLEKNTLALNDGKKEKIAINSNNIYTTNEKILFQPSSRSIIDLAQEPSKKSQQRHVKLRNLYGTSTLPILSCPIWMFPPQILNQLLLTFSIVFWTTTGQPRFFLQFNNSRKRMVYVNDVVISELVHRYQQRRWLRSVKVKRGRGASNLKLVPRDWRKYPP